MSSWQNGGGDRYLEEIPVNARKFAARVKKNVEDWNFDGVDFFNLVREPRARKYVHLGISQSFGPNSLLIPTREIVNG